MAVQQLLIVHGRLPMPGFPTAWLSSRSFHTATVYDIDMLFAPYSSLFRLSLGSHIRARACSHVRWIRIVVAVFSLAQYFSTCYMPRLSEPTALCIFSDLMYPSEHFLT